MATAGENEDNPATHGPATNNLRNSWGERLTETPKGKDQ
jgi:hypothetical protein